MARLVIVSNRVAVPEEGGKAVAAGGLAVAVKEAFTAYEGLWFGWSGTITEEPSEEPTLIDRGRVQYAVVDLSPQDHLEYYAGFANRALWPIMHYRLGLGAFSRSDYAGYSRVNRTFARALAKLVEPDDIIWVHDYHLLPLAAELRGLGLDNPIGYFHHIPWPAADVFNSLPASSELLRAIVDYDLIGLQTEADVQNLQRNLDRYPAGDPARRRLADGRRPPHPDPRLPDRHRRRGLQGRRREGGIQQGGARDHGGPAHAQAADRRRPARLLEGRVASGWRRWRASSPRTPTSAATSPTSRSRRNPAARCRNTSSSPAT